MTNPTRRRPGELVVLILALVERRGRVTRADVCKELDIGQRTGGALMTRLCRTGPRTPKRLYVVDWRWDQPGARNYPRAIYALCVTGKEVNKPLPDKPKIADPRRQADKAFKQANSSVFAWAQNLAKRPAKYRKRKPKSEQQFTKKD